MGHNFRLQGPLLLDAEAVTFVRVQRLLLSFGCGGRYFRSGIGAVTFVRVQRPLLSFGRRGCYFRSGVGAVTLVWV